MSTASEPLLEGTENTAAITVNGLGKLYHLGQHASYSTLRDGLAGIFRNFRGARETDAGESELLWALRDVSFEVRRGEILGVIGRNGSGKSTLLKILSRIIDPTEGWARIRGRVAALLEVGTGFHPELTGKENVYLSGSILGMTKKQIAERYDEIVAFSEVGRFCDTPVKRYSTGMRVRLAFAVSAHLDPEILLIDEVLAVGDAAFRNKCFEKMNRIAADGRTILFVTHDLPSVRSFCTRVVWLKDGRVAGEGAPGKVTHDFMNSMGLADEQ